MPTKGFTKGLLLLLVVLLIQIVNGLPHHVHISWETDPSSSVTITWRTIEVGASEVEWGLNESYGFTTTGPPGLLHHVRLENLMPSTRYYYRCGDGKNWSERFEFTTGPGDDSEGFSFAAIGDDRGSYGIRRSIGLEILDTDADFIIHTGDLVSDGNDQNQWNRWFESYAELLPRLSMMPAPGNHEENSPRYFDQMALPGNENWYSFDYGNAHFVSLNTEAPLMGDQLEWLHHDLASSNSTWKFVYFHRPMYSSGYHGSDYSRQAWEAVLLDHDVDIVFSGHNHIYERTRPIRFGTIVDIPDGITHVITGGGGAGLHPLGVSLYPWTEIAVSEHHYVILTIEEGDLHLEARLPDGTVFDTFDIQKVPHPDLMVESLTVDPLYPVPGEEAKISAEVVNRGTSTSDESKTRFSINGDPYLEVTTPSLEGGESIGISFSITPQMEGPMKISAVADCLDSINELLGESNNRVEANFIISDPLPDLEIAEVTYTPIPPRVDDELSVSITIENIGSTSSGEFSVNISLGDELRSRRIGDLSPGNRVVIEINLTVGIGDWFLSTYIDSAQEVVEVREDNNRENLTIQVRDLVGIGPAYIPTGISPEETIVIYYNSSDGPIGNSSRIAVAWGIDGWERPPIQSADLNTLTLSRNFQKEMEKIEENLWKCVIPSGAQIETINLRFYDRPIVPSIIDDNGGMDWSIFGVLWAEARLTEFSLAINASTAAGVDVSNYHPILDEARDYLAAYDFVGLDMLIGNLTNELRRKESMGILGKASYEYQRALDEGIDPGRAGLYLEAANLQLDKGNYLDTSRLGLLVLDQIQRARITEIPGFLLLLPLLIVLHSKRKTDC